MSYQLVRHFRRVDITHTVPLPGVAEPAVPANAIRQRDNEPLQQRDEQYIEHR